MQSNIHAILNYLDLEIRIINIPQGLVGCLKILRIQCIVRENFEIYQIKKETHTVMSSSSVKIQNVIINPYSDKLRLKGSLVYTSTCICNSHVQEQIVFL